MSKGRESIVASLELCKLIPEGEFEDSALVWRERIGYISSSVGLKFRASEDIGYKSESVKVNYFPAPTTWEIMMIAKRRKTLVVCKKCHIAIHNQ